MDGLRVTVRLLGEQVQVAVDQPTAPRMARELADALASRGLQLQGSGAEGRGDGTDAQPRTQADPDAGRGTPDRGRGWPGGAEERATRPARPTTRRDDDVVLL